MIYFIEGKIEELTPTYVVVSTHGVGYHIQVSVRTAEQLQEGSNIRLLTQMIVKEDAHLLFGFADKLERDTFNMLITVSGIGVNTARVILSTLSSNDVISAIMYDDDNSFKKVKGIGAKTAKRIILDLKDKASKLQVESMIVEESSEMTSGKQQFHLKNEALTALTVLGFSSAQCTKVLDAILKKEEISSVEDLIKKALAKL
ncbi:MAG: Holliday junction branch migration protein RuvA [Flavobacteriales bacterium]|jgi:Holliday junction DNA helicase RuvA|nr:Holliday junction branch migration protein RuvA [Flavobacteriales bacterium]